MVLETVADRYLEKLTAIVASPYLSNRIHLLGDWEATRVSLPIS